MTRRSPSQGNLKGEQFLQKEKKEGGWGGGGAPLGPVGVGVGAKWFQSYFSGSLIFVRMGIA